MNLTTEQIQAILDGAPDGATHWQAGYDIYYILDDKTRAWIGDEWVNYFAFVNTHKLSDLREILELRQEVERVKLEAIKLLDAAICPCCDKSGAYYDNHGEVCQCQWCDEVNKLREQGDE